MLDFFRAIKKVLNTTYVIRFLFKASTKNRIISNNCELLLLAYYFQNREREREENRTNFQNHCSNFDYRGWKFRAVLDDLKNFGR